MAVQKSRVTRSRVGMRRSHSALKKKETSIDKTSGEVHLRHHVTASGMYRGEQMIAQPTAVSDEE